MKTNKETKKSANTEDRRIRKTKKVLKQALTDLILEKGYDEVSVQDVIDRADVGRTSFYSHFRSKEDLLLQNLDDLENMFFPEKNEEKISQDDFSLKMFEHLQENWRLARLLLGNKKIPVVRNYVQNLLMKYYKTSYSEKYKDTLSEFEIEGAAVLASGALVSLTLWWFAMKKPVSPREMHRLFLQNIRLDPR